MPRLAADNRKASIDAVFFDWDGTLVDTTHAGRDAFAKAFADLGIAFDEAIYNGAYSPNWIRIYEAFDIAQSRWADLDARWRAHFNQSPTTLFARVRDALAQLHASGVTLGIITSAQRDRIHAELDAFGLRDVFSIVVSHDDVVHKKPHPEALELAMRLAGVEPRRTCYIGDAPQDIEMAAAAGTIGVAVRSEYPSNPALVRTCTCLRLSVADAAEWIATRPDVTDCDACATRLVVYGSLAPGRSNHHVVEMIAGTWRDVTIRGTLIDRGWGAQQGYPGVVLDGGSDVRAQLLESRELARHWDRLDEFEGAEYLRRHTLARRDGTAILANVYELA